MKAELKLVVLVLPLNTRFGSCRRWVCSLRTELCLSFSTILVDTQTAIAAVNNLQ